jgi:hypothetical protein
MAYFGEGQPVKAVTPKIGVPALAGLPLPARAERCLRRSHPPKIAEGTTNGHENSVMTTEFS